MFHYRVLYYNKIYHIRGARGTVSSHFLKLTQDQPSWEPLPVSEYYYINSRYEVQREVNYFQTLVKPDNFQLILDAKPGSDLLLLMRCYCNIFQIRIPDIELFLIESFNFEASCIDCGFHCDIIGGGVEE